MIVSAPLYVLAAAVAFQRLDSGAHDIDDVIAGAVIGFLSARQVHRERQMNFLGAQFGPYIDPASGGAGISLSWSF